MSLDGFYAGYFSGYGGSGMAMFIFVDGGLTGADMAGVTFDGSYAKKGEVLEGVVHVKVPPGVTVVQGMTAPPQGLEYDVPIAIPAEFEAQPYFELRTPLGVVNVRLVKTRDI